MDLLYHCAKFGGTRIAPRHGTKKVDICYPQDARSTYTGI